MTASDLSKAIRIVTEAHHGHCDRNGLPYLYHLFYVSDAQPTIEGKILGILHDSVEDGKLTPEEIESEFGVNMRIWVNALSRGKEESYNSYIRRVMEFTITMRVKLVDIEHNTLIDRVDERAAKKFPTYRESYRKIAEKLGVSPFLSQP